MVEGRLTGLLNWAGLWRWGDGQISPYRDQAVMVKGETSTEEGGLMGLAE
jgi:hypothetical protein